MLSVFKKQSGFGLFLWHIEQKLQDMCTGGTFLIFMSLSVLGNRRARNEGHSTGFSASKAGES